MQTTQRIEGYDSFEKLAMGGMATVHKARKTSLSKPVAIKILHEHLARDVVFIERFKREAQTAAKIQHDNIVNVIDCGEANGSHYIVMEYYDGFNLETLLEEQPAVPIDVCFAIILNVCYGLEAAHCENLVHRDIKPANIICTHRGGVKIADFGLAKTVDKMKPITHDGKIVGTPAYMSPEQTRGEHVDAQSDIFSLGVVAYELVCGERPFDGRSYSEVVDKIQTVVLPSVSMANPLVDASFDSIIAKMLEKDLSKRYRHASEVVMDLEEAIDKQRYKRDLRRLFEYFKYPQACLEKFNVEQLEKLLSKPPRAEGGDAEAQILYYTRLLYLKPSDKKARERLERLRASRAKTVETPDKAPGRRSPAGVADSVEAGGMDARQAKDADPKADYQVVLLAIDRTVETPESFALKLSIRIRSPLPRAVSIVKNIPSTVGGHLSYKKAKKLAHIMEELGGTAVIEVNVGSRETARNRKPEPNAGSKSPRDSESPDDEKGFDQAKTEQYDPIEHGTAHRKSAGPAPAITCPKCGWEADADAKFCSICFFKFNGTNELDLRSLSVPVLENPLASRSGERPAVSGLLDKLSGLPKNVKYIGLGGLIVLILLIIFGR